MIKIKLSTSNFLNLYPQLVTWHKIKLNNLIFLLSIAILLFYHKFIFRFSNNNHSMIAKVAIDWHLKIPDIQRLKRTLLTKNYWTY